MENNTFILQHGQVKSLAENSDAMEISGWISTDQVDLSQEIVEPQAAKKFLSEYKKAGRLWYNHSPNQVLGKVHEIDITEKGIHVGRAKLAETPFNKDYIWPLIKEGALSEFSIQFKSMQGKWVQKVYHHQEIYLIEASIVSVACNPGAVIDGFKSLVPSSEWYNANLTDLFALESAGKLLMPSEIRSQFAIDGFRDNNSMKLDITNSEPLTPDFGDIEILESDFKSYDPTGEALALPKKEQKNYVEVCDNIFLAKSAGRGAYMFRVGIPTEKGYKFDWEATALSTGNVLGARGGAYFGPEQKEKALEQLAYVYTHLGKKAPTYKGIGLSNLDPEFLPTLKFADVEFHEGERELIEEKIQLDSLNAVVNRLKSFEGDVQKEKLEEVVKYLGASFDINFYASVDDADEAKFISDLLALYAAYQAADAAEGDGMDTCDNCGSTIMNFAQFLLSQSETKTGEDEIEGEVKVEETETAPVVEEVAEVTSEEEAVPVEDEQKALSLIEALQAFAETRKK